MVWAGYLYLFAFLFCYQSLTALRAAAVEVFVLPGCCTGCVDAKQIGDNDLSSTVENAETKSKPKGIGSGGFCSICL
jgi:hypothetical protein